MTDLMSLLKFAQAEAGNLSDTPNNLERQRLFWAITLSGLSSTVKFAQAKCPYYRGYPIRRISTISDYRELPILGRREVEQNLSSLCSRDQQPIGFDATSGTTTGRSLYIPRSADERSAGELYRQVIYSHNLRNDSSSDGITLRLVPGGRLISPTTHSDRQIIAVYFNNMARENIWDNWDTIITQIYSSFPCGGQDIPITTIHATPPYGLILLTRYMLQRGLQPSDSNVKYLAVTGSWIGKVTRKWLEDTWNAQLITAYSCAELYFSAAECPVEPGRFHFDHHVFPEVVDGESVHVEPGSEGRLLLTGLYPFHQACMLLRYAVGDWVRWNGYEQCECGAFGPAVEFLSREQDLTTINSPSDPVTIHIGSVPILEALDRFDFVPKVPRPQYKLHLEESGNLYLTLRVECYAIGSEDWQKCAVAQIRDAVLDTCRALRDAVEAKDIHFIVKLYPRSGLTVRLSAR